MNYRLPIYVSNTDQYIFQDIYFGDHVGTLKSSHSLSVININ